MLDKQEWYQIQDFFFAFVVNLKYRVIGREIVENPEYLTNFSNTPVGSTLNLTPPESQAWVQTYILTVFIFQLSASLPVPTLMTPEERRGVEFF